MIDKHFGAEFFNFFLIIKILQIVVLFYNPFLMVIKTAYVNPLMS